MNVTTRRRIAACAVALAVPALASCAGSPEQTDLAYTPGAGVNDRTGSVDVLHALVVSDSDGSGTVVAALVNNDDENDDGLAQVAGAGEDESVQAQSTATTPVEAGGAVQLADEGNVLVTGEQIQPGRFVNLTFSFERGESVTMMVPVVSRTGDYADVPVSSGSE